MVPSQLQGLFMASAPAELRYVKIYHENCGIFWHIYCTCLSAGHISAIVSIEPHPLGNIGRAAAHVILELHGIDWHGCIPQHFSAMVFSYQQFHMILLAKWGDWKCHWYLNKSFPLWVLTPDEPDERHPQYITPTFWISIMLHHHINYSKSL